ncbi:MAG: DsbA family protein [Candidatus Nitrosocosmicus sp.]
MNLNLLKGPLKASKKRFPATLIALSFLLAVVSFSFFGFFDNNTTSSIVNALAQTQESEINNPLALSTLIKQGSPYYGNETAPITIIDFSDFQCSLCKRYVDNTEQQINSTYVQNGEIAYVFKHLPNRGFDSKNASLAAQCTNDQDKFWDFHQILYANQGPIDSGWVNTENLKKFASQVPGINNTEFNSCFDNKKYESFIDKDIALANSLGFTETPSFIIVKNDGSSPQKIEGPKPFPIFQLEIEKFSISE